MVSAGVKAHKESKARKEDKKLREQELEQQIENAKQTTKDNKKNALKNIAIKYAQNISKTNEAKQQEAISNTKKENIENLVIMGTAGISILLFTYTLIRKK